MSKLMAKQQQINHELATLIDQDLKQEQALLKALIAEILKANEKIKNAHFERVEDTEAKLKVLNAEIKRIRKNIRGQDDIVQEKRLSLLKETKQDYFAAVSELRLKDVKDHFAMPLHKHIKDLSDGLLADVKQQLPNRFKEFQPPIDLFFQSLQNSITLEAVESIAQATDTAEGINAVNDEIQSVLAPFKALIQSFKTKLDASLDAHLKLFDTSELDELLRDIEATTMQDLAMIDDQASAIDEALTDELQQMDDDFNQLKQDALNEALKGLPTELDKSRSDALAKELKDLQKQMTKEKDLKQQAILLKTYKATQNRYYKTPVGKISQKIDKKFKAESKQLVLAKKAKRNEHLEQSYELKMQKEERTIQAVIDGASLKLRTNLDVLDIQSETYNQTIDLLEQYLLDLFNFERALESLFVSLRIKVLELSSSVAENAVFKAEYLAHYKQMVQRLEIQSLQSLSNRQFDFKKLHVSMEEKLETERLDIEHLYALSKINDQRFRLINRTRINKIDELQALKFEMFQDESDIKLAEKEYDIQVLKAQSVYDHERAINKVQTERIDAGVHVNKAMVQATVKRQVNFADQQIRFADAELTARLEHIEFTLQQELSYTEETLGYQEKAYVQKQQELELDYQSKKQSIAQKKKLFQHSTMINNVLQEEKDLEIAVEEKREALEDKIANDVNIRRYREQIAKAKEHAENAKADAIRLHEKDIESFEALKAESLERLANVEKMMAEPALLPYHEETIDDQASLRLKEMLESAEGFLKEKLKAPRKRLQDTQERLLALEKEGTSSNELALLLRQEKEIAEVYQHELRQLADKTETEHKRITREFEKEANILASHLSAIDDTLDQPLRVDTAMLKSLGAVNAKQSTALQKALETTLREIDAKEDEWIIDLKRTQDDAIRERMNLVVKTQMKVEKIEGLQKPAINESFKALKKAFRKEKF